MIASGVVHSGGEIEGSRSGTSWIDKVSTHPKSSTKGEGGGFRVAFGGYND